MLILLQKKDTSCDTLHIHLNSIHLKYTNITKLPDLVGVQQLHSPCAFIEVIFEGYRTVIFVNGCFWHGHEGCKYFVLPKSRTEFWQAKIERNRERDLEEQRKLAEMGWHCITVWECQLKPKVREKTLQSLEYTLCHIYLEDHKVKRYEMREEERVMAAEPDVEKK